MILIGVACTETIKSKTAFSLFSLAAPDVRLAMQMGCDVAYNRNVLAEMATKDYSHLLFVDSDMLFNADTLQKMLAHDKDILAVAYNRRKLPLESVVKTFDADVKPLPTTLFEAASAGTGLMLIKCEVFKKIPKPWFEFEYVGGELHGEDVSFCRKAREAGYSIWVDPTIPVRHIGEYLY